MCYFLGSSVDAREHDRGRGGARERGGTRQGGPATEG